MRLAAALLMCCLATFALRGSARAANIRVLSASELRLEPRLRPDEHSLDVTVFVRDDRQRPIRTQVRLFLQREGATEREVAVGRSDERGTANFIVEVPVGDRAFNLVARTPDAERMAGSQTMVRVDMDAPFITLDLDVAAQVDASPDETIPVTVSVTVGDRTARGMQIGLRVDERLVTTARVDASDRVIVQLHASQFRGPGIHTLRAEHARAGFTVSSPRRRMVLRDSTNLTLERVSSPEGTLLVRGTLFTPDGPVVDGPVRLMDGSVVLASASTDGSGTYVASLDPELMYKRDISLRAVFLPNEPWYKSAESPAIRITSPVHTSVHWSRLALPAAVIFAAFIAVQLRMRRAASEPLPADPEREARNSAVFLHRVSSPSASTEVEIDLIVSDFSTGAALPSAVCEWSAPFTGMRKASERVSFRAPGRVKLRVSAEGYQPRDVDVMPSGAGHFTLRVALSSHREALFSSARPLLRAARPNEPVLVTLREASSKTDPTTPASSLFKLVEEGTYGPVAPDAASVARAEELARESAPRPSVPPQPPQPSQSPR